MPHRIRLREVSWPADAAALAQIRREVFIQEQGVPEPLEFDGLDAAALHWLASGPDNLPLGTLRLLPSGQIGRMAVAQAWRGHGIGTRLLDGALQAARRHGWSSVWLNAQNTRIGFYARHHFFIISDLFEDAGIAHRRMQCRLHPLHAPGKTNGTSPHERAL